MKANPGKTGREVKEQQVAIHYMPGNAATQARVPICGSLGHEGTDKANITGARTAIPGFIYKWIKCTYTQASPQTYTGALRPLNSKHPPEKDALISQSWKLTLRKTVAMKHSNWNTQIYPTGNHCVSEDWLLQGIAVQIYIWFCSLYCTYHLNNSLSLIFCFKGVLA